MAALGDCLLAADFNVTAIRDPLEIERMHLLDSLSLLTLPLLTAATDIVDIGSGAGLPALVLAIALPSTKVVALESQRKKCAFIERAAIALSLANVSTECARAEEYGRGDGKARHSLAVSRALAPLPVIAEYSLPLLKMHGYMLAMKGYVSVQERIQASSALGILGGGELEGTRLRPFPESENHWVYVSEKIAATPEGYPRRPGIPLKRPLGRMGSQEGSRP